MANPKLLSGAVTAFHGTRHAHGRCVGRALSRAEALCRQRGARLTQMRRRVLELIWDSHKAVKAYDLLDRLSESEKSVRPPTVYRALDFLMAHGLVHRVRAGVEQVAALVFLQGLPIPTAGEAAEGERDLHDTA